MCDRIRMACSAAKAAWDSGKRGDVSHETSPVAEADIVGTAPANGSAVFPQDEFDPALVGMIAREFPDYRILTDIRNLYEITRRRIFAMHKEDDRKRWFNPDECLMASAIRVGYPYLFNQIIRNKVRLGELISHCEDLSDEADTDAPDADYRSRVQSAYTAFRAAVPPLISNCFTEEKRYLSINYLLYMADWEGKLTGAGWVLMNSTGDSRLSSLPIDDVDARGIVSCYAPREWAGRIASNRAFMKYVCDRLDRSVKGGPDDPWDLADELTIYNALISSLSPSDNERGNMEVYCERNRYYHNLRSVYPQLAPGVQQSLLSKVLSPICLADPSGKGLASQQRYVTSFIILSNDLYKNEEATLDKTFSHNLTESDAGTCSNGMLYVTLGDGETEFGDDTGYRDRERELRGSLPADGTWRYPQDAVTLNNLGVLHRRMRLFSRAEQEFLTALGLCQQAPAVALHGNLRKDSDTHVGPVAMTVCSNLGSMCAALNRFDDADAWLGHAWHVAQAQYPQNVPWWPDADEDAKAVGLDEHGIYRIQAAILNNLGTLHIKTEQIGDAETELKRSLTMLNDAVARILAGFNDKNKDDLDARFNTAESDMRRLLADCADPHLAMVLNNLGNLRRRTSNQRKAQLEIDAALRIYRRLASVHPDVRIVVERSDGDLTTGPVVSCDELLVFGSPYVSYLAMTLNNYGNLKRRRKLSDEAENDLRAAKTLYDGLADRFAGIGDHMYLADTAMVLNNLGNLYGDSGKTLGKAEEALVEALDIREHRMPNGPLDAADIAMLHNNLGVNYGKMKNFTQARFHLDEAKRMRGELTVSRGQLGQQVYRPRVADTENNLGNLYMQMRLPKDALREYEDALREYKELLKDGSRRGVYLPREAMTLNNLGILCMRIGQPEQAEQHFKQSRQDYEDLLKSFTGRYEPRLAMVLNNLGNLYQQPGALHDVAQAAECLTSAYQLYDTQDRKLYGANLAMTLNNLCVLYQDEWVNGGTALANVKDELLKYATEMAKICESRNESARAVPFANLVRILEAQNNKGESEPETSALAPATPTPATPASAQGADSPAEAGK
ncbi:tetratricopeptide repeat protein [Bifidobacterium aerophilum]|nr:tetratricopeptide repeat protein [Bifidobacterium aerophilum]